MISSQWKVRGLLAGGIGALGIISYFSDDPYRVVLGGILGFMISEFALAIQEETSLTPLP